MPRCEIHKAVVFEDSGLTLMARIVGNDGEYIKQADFGTITYAVHDSDGAEVTASTSLTPANVIFDTLQTSGDDPRWPHGDVGFNFAFVLPAASSPTGGKTNLVEVKFVPSSGEPFHVVWEVGVLDLKRS